MVPARPHAADRRRRESCLTDSTRGSGRGARWWLLGTRYQPLRGPEIRSHQYSTTKNSKNINLGMGGAGLPGVFFFYEFSSIRITYVESRSTFLHFLTHACAIVGGVFTVRAGPRGGEGTNAS